MLSGEEVLVKVTWSETPDGWAGTLVTATETERVTRPLRVGLALELEVTDERRCVGYADRQGRHLCPDAARIDSGQQCYACRNHRDAFRGYVEGRSGASRSGEHSVYLAQCGETVKVGVTRSSRLLKRWVEQGAAFAVEIHDGLTADEALAREAALSRAGLPERVGKHAKVPTPTTCRLPSVMADHGVDGDVVDLRERTIYPPVRSSTVVREGRVAGEVRSVVGQLVEVGGQCLAVTAGRCIRPPRQTGLTDY